MSRLDSWIADEVAMYEREFGPMGADERERYREALGKTLHGAQLRFADDAEKLWGSARGGRRNARPTDHRRRQTMTEVATHPDAIFNASEFDLPIPVDAHGTKATKLVVTFGQWEADRTSEDDLDVFNALVAGETVSLTLECEVVQEQPISRFSSGEDGGHTVEVKRGLRVVSVSKEAS